MKRVAAFLVTLAVATLSACAQSNPGAARTGFATSSSSSPSQAEAMAQSIVYSLEHNGNKATAAIYVETSLGSYINALTPSERPPSSIGSPGDRVLVIKVVGSFVSCGRCSGLSGTKDVTPRTLVVDVYDETTKTNIETSYFTGPPTADMPGSTADAPTENSPYADLRVIGTPQALNT